eukprot:3847693-Lingulodinium_polyedra.AAC.1
MSTPLPWSKAWLQQLSHYPAPQQPHPQMPKWAQAVAKNRDLLIDAILIIESVPGHKEYFKF